MPIIRGSTSRGAHVRAIYEVLTSLIDDLPQVPTERRVRLRTCRAALVRAYPGELELNESALAQDLEDADGVPVED